MSTGPLPPDPPQPDNPKFRSFFFLSRHHSVFSLNCGGVFEAPGPSNVHVWAFGLSSKREHWPQRFHTPPKNHETTPKGEIKRPIMGRRSEKKTRHFGIPPAPLPPTLRFSPPFGTSLPPFGAHFSGFWAPPFKAPTLQGHQPSGPSAGPSSAGQAKISIFSSSHFRSFSLWGSSRGILMVFEASVPVHGLQQGRPPCHWWFTSMCAVCTGDQGLHPWFRCAHASLVALKRKHGPIDSSAQWRTQPSTNKPEQATNNNKRQRTQGRLAAALTHTLVCTLHLLLSCTKFHLPTALLQQRHGPRLLHGTVCFV